MNDQQPSGILVIIGGAEDKEGDCVVLRSFLKKAGGVKASIAVMTAATGSPKEVGDEYKRIFERLGAESVKMVHTENRADSEREDSLRIIEQATGIFFTGGDQLRIVEFIKETPLDEAIHKRYQEGAVIAGTSAGAAMMPDQMIVGGASVSNPSVDAVSIGPGMGFLPGILIDQHFAQRGRLGRLLAALVQQPADLGLGIDENTGIIVEGDSFEVVGQGAVTVVDETTSTYNNLKELLKDEAIAVCGVQLHILPHGYRFDLKKRLPLLSKEKS
ncbi:cyanophycinase [Gloeocapsa sp. PCC 73106]|uniref:cyanophycinase n=1 Tax=Gloeocapsa sp. PCC 73106 TaxID=102232 RepID=UPI0002ABEF72|nr:cyanophycinase [Gloeocapsa sp. PCC 73106]ELS00061.1 cyanophycinase [Gloeocapsa sp. PCC 73106]